MIIIQKKSIVTVFYNDVYTYKKVIEYNTIVDINSVLKHHKTICYDSVTFRGYKIHIGISTDSFYINIYINLSDVEKLVEDYLKKYLDMLDMDVKTKKQTSVKQDLIRIYKNILNSLKFTGVRLPEYSKYYTIFNDIAPESYFKVTEDVLNFLKEKS